MSGFTLVLASLKMYLEHGIEADLMYDKFPDAEYADRRRGTSDGAPRTEVT